MRRASYGMRSMGRDDEHNPFSTVGVTVRPTVRVREGLCKFPIVAHLIISKWRETRGSGC
jgi:hypothetical protein